MAGYWQDSTEIPPTIGGERIISKPPSSPYLYGLETIGTRDRHFVAEILMKYCIGTTDLRGSELKNVACTWLAQLWIAPTFFGSTQVI